MCEGEKEGEGTGVQVFENHGDDVVACHWKAVLGWDKAFNISLSPARHSHILSYLPLSLSYFLYLSPPPPQLSLSLSHTNAQTHPCKLAA